MTTMTWVGFNLVVTDLGRARASRVLVNSACGATKRSDSAVAAPTTAAKVRGCAA